MYATRALRMRPTMRMMRLPNEDQGVYTPVNSYILAGSDRSPETDWRNGTGVVVLFAVAAAGYSSGRKFFVDKNLRLARQNRQDEPAEHSEEHH
ncbi:hypothetical protein NPX13_g7280 [Xylaria arbuscula]|uniref:Uncharacterized protein n=1 Tax=Xylaria arbuscula TaxID=114810 RepID=A0A9W8NAS7_9PEZI|nr:hypothetical protein NPX13_g7280 [Xylaria arbuscula]